MDVGKYGRRRVVRVYGSLLLCSAVWICGFAVRTCWIPRTDRTSLWLYAPDSDFGCRQHGSRNETERRADSESDANSDSKSYDIKHVHTISYRDSYGNSDTNENSYNYGHTYSDSVVGGYLVKYGVKYTHSVTHPFSQLFADSHAAFDT